MLDEVWWAFATVPGVLPDPLVAGGVVAGAVPLGAGAWYTARKWRRGPAPSGPAVLPPQRFFSARLRGTVARLAVHATGSLAVAAARTAGVVTLRRIWALVAAALVLWVLVRSFGSGVLDLRVYLAGGEAWWSGADLYTAAFTAPKGLPFTYPPFAAVLFSALTAVPVPLAAVLFTAAGIGLFTAACHLAAPDPRAAPGLAAVCLLLEPLRGGLDLGQVNMVLIGLVAADCLLPRTPWPRGTLVGIAAAIKLTPAVFVLFFLCRGRWRPALTAVASFTACGLAGWALAPGQSRQFWFDAVLDPHRVGGLAYSANQSLRGLLFRLGAPDSAWLVSALLVLAVTAFLAVRLRDDLTALVAVAAAGLLISPVSWSHHWVWIAPALVLLRGRVRVAAAAVFAVGPHWLLPTAGDRELAWTWWQHLAGNGYVWLGLAFLGWCLVRVAGPGRFASVSRPGVVTRAAR